jgi:predicted tellurium resistance membrane protein TerC
MTFGLVLSVVLMAVAAGFVAKLIGKFRWIGYLGIAIIVFAAVQMIWEDASHLFPDRVPPMPHLGGARTPHPA